VLSAHLRQEQPAQIPLLHQRASAWYAQHGAAADAVRHALAAEDFARAADLVELAMPEMRRSRQEVALLGWLRALPDELVRRRPVLSVHYAGLLLDGGELQDVEARLRDAERRLETPEVIGVADVGVADMGAEMVVVDEEEFRRLPGWIAIYRAGYALAQGNVPNTVQHAQLALDLIAEEDDLGRGAATALLGLASWASGDLETAYRTFADGMARVQRAGYISDVINSTIALAEIRMAQGRLHAAMSTYERGLQLATEPGAPVLRGAADMHVGMSELYRERNDLHAATQHLLRSQELGEHSGMPQYRYRRRVAMARIHEAQGDLDGALDLLDAAERLYVIDLFPNVRPVAALKTRVWVAQGRLDEALGWAREQGLSTDDDLGYLREFEHITLARVLLGQGQSDRAEGPLLEAMGLLDRLLQAAQAGGRTGSAIEILVLQALSLQMQGAQHGQGDIPGALIPLQHALALAEPQGYVRIFVDEGPPMAHLLREAAGRGIMPAYTGKLLAEFESPSGADQPSRGVRPRLPSSGAAPPLVEPLSERELEVLRLFQSELSGPEIAAELVVALSTVRTHTKHIFGKLHVNSRRAAVKRAAELGLL
jgi:LuxR family maltose regulon positive regulatory protein